MKSLRESNCVSHTNQRAGFSDEQQERLRGQDAEAHRQHRDNMAEEERQVNVSHLLI